MYIARVWACRRRCRYHLARVRRNVDRRADEHLDAAEHRPHVDGPSADLFLDDFSAHADGEVRGVLDSRRVASERSRVRRVGRCLQIGAGPRRSPSACPRGAEKKTKKNALGAEVLDVLGRGQALLEEVEQAADPVRRRDEREHQLEDLRIGYGILVTAC